jgi:hypothetical protein
VMKPFRFGVNASSAGSRAERTDKARKAEELGYSVFTVPDLPVYSCWLCRTGHP